jgi:hypothetical protein
MRFVCDDLASCGLQDLPRRGDPGWQAPPQQVICYTRLFGAVPKWPKGEVCKTSIRGFESHPRLHFFAFAFTKLQLPSLNLYPFCTFDYQRIFAPGVAHVCL